MDGGGAQGSQDGVAQGDYDRLVHLVYGIVHHGYLNIMGCLPRFESQDSRGQGVIGPVTGGGASGHGVIHFDREFRDQGQGHRQQSGIHRFVVGRSGGLKGHRRWKIVILYGVSVLHRGAQRAPGSVTDCDKHGLVGLVGGIVGYRQRDVFGGLAGGEGQCPRGQGVIGAGPGSGAAGDVVLYRGSQSGFHPQ